MQYAAIYLCSKPWSGEKVFLGLVAQDPKSGDVKIFRDRAWRWRVQKSSPQSGDKAAYVAERFFESLHRLVQRSARGPQAPTVADILRNVQDRGTACQLGAVSYGEFATVDEALKHCRLLGVSPKTNRTSAPGVGLGRPLVADVVGA